MRAADQFLSAGGHKLFAGWCDGMVKRAKLPLHGEWHADCQACALADAAELHFTAPHPRPLSPKGRGEMDQSQGDVMTKQSPVRCSRVAMGSIVVAWLLACELAAETKPEPKLVPLNPQQTVLIDKEGKRVLLKTKVVLREGLLEMLCCLKQTKEHESILSLDSKAYVVHAALLAIDAKPGTPVRFVPKYQPPTGQRIDVFLNWTDSTGMAHRVPAQHWVQHSNRKTFNEPLAALPAGIKIPDDSPMRYDPKEKLLLWDGPMFEKERDRHLALSKDPAYRKAIEKFFEGSKIRQMEAHWVFAGSSFSVDEKTGEKSYLAEDGDVICVSNFATATLDVTIPSSSTNAGLLFEAYTERIPPKGTEVTVELVPVVKK
jgi:hypothetical protein